MNRTIVKVAASSLVLGFTTVGCQMDGTARPQGIAQAQGRVEQGAPRLAHDAATAAQAGNLTGAIASMEQAVALSPRDAGYRMTLAELYMRSGRFQSAATTYGDVLSIDPANGRAALSRALMLSASGRGDQAIAQLDQLGENAPAADLGLAYALAGNPQRGIEILEPAARSNSATARTRQNLALSYALAGNWAQARTIASQDLSPGDVPQRMEQWASMASADRPGVQVASLLGVAPANDPGQPVQLALNGGAPVQMAEAPAPVQTAAAEIPAPAPVAVPVAEVQMASADAVPMPTDGQAPAAEAPTNAYAQLETPDWGVESNGAVRLPAPDAEEEQIPARVRYAAAARDLVRADPTVIRAGNAPIRRAVASAWTGAGADIPAPLSRTENASGGGSANGAFVVQLGAFSNQGNAERAWQQVSGRFGLAERSPVTMTIDMGGRVLHRVAVGGFETRGGAVQLCNTIRARGGECFVRMNAGDATIRWASRYGRSARG